MPSPDKLKRQINSAKEFQTIIKTMKGLAAVNIHQYDHAVMALRHYHQTLTLGIRIFLMHYPNTLKELRIRESPRLGVVIFGSDHGMCGRFNEQIADVLIQSTEGFSPELSPVLALGGRMGDALAARQCSPQACFSMPASIDGITLKIQDIVLYVERWQQTREVDRIILLHNQPAQGNVYGQSIQQLFPPIGLSDLQALQQEPWPSRAYPQVFLDRDRLFSALFHQHFFVTLYRACAESLISENMSRLASMQVAQKNVTDHLIELQQSFQQQRQSMITEELLDIISGFEAMNGT